MIRDFQRSAVYAWETRLFGAPKASHEPSLTLPACRRLLARAWRGYVSQARNWGSHEARQMPPTVTDGRGRRRPCFNSEDPFHGPCIKLPCHARRASQVLHETAHAIIWARGLEGKVASHGPEFVRLYMELLVHYGGFDPTYLKDALGKVRVSDTCDLPWRAAA